MEALIVKFILAHQILQGVFGNIKWQIMRNLFHGMLLMFSERKSNTCSNIDTRKFNYCPSQKLKGSAVWLPSHNLPSQMNSAQGAYKTVISIYFLFCGLIRLIINFLYAPTTNLRIDFKGKLENMPTF